MKRKIIGIILSVFMAVSIVGCRDNNIETVKTKDIGNVKMVNISNKIWYDQKTKIVYFWNGSLGLINCATAPTPYYGVNGKPCMYDEASDQIVELE